MSPRKIRELILRCLADSNRRTWFCRPLTKPLIQGTVPHCKDSPHFAFAKVALFFLTTNYERHFLQFYHYFIAKKEKKSHI